MNNNGTGLVLANLALSDHLLVLLPIISYNLVQHLIAGWVDTRLQTGKLEERLHELQEPQQDIKKP